MADLWMRFHHRPWKFGPRSPGGESLIRSFAGHPPGNSQNKAGHALLQQGTDRSPTESGPLRINRKNTCGIARVSGPSPMIGPPSAGDRWLIRLPNPIDPPTPIMVVPSTSARGGRRRTLSIYRRLRPDLTRSGQFSRRAARYHRSDTPRREPGRRPIRGILERLGDSTFARGRSGPRRRDRSPRKPWLFDRGSQRSAPPGLRPAPSRPFDSFTGRPRLL